MHPAYQLLFIFLVMLVLFVSGRLRYDIVSALGLFAATLLGIVPYKQVFSGLGNPAVVTVGLVMIITKTISRTNLLDICNQKTKGLLDRPLLYGFSLCLITAFFSAFMNNVGALALTMPLAIQSSIKAKRSPSLILLPLAVCSVLGGMTTAIGTPPNILISNYREQIMGHSYGMFSFTAVGLPVAVIGIFFVTLIGWRLIPARRNPAAKADELFQIEDYIAEVLVPTDNSMVNKTITDVEHLVKGDIMVVGLIRQNTRHFMVPPHRRLNPGDILLIEASHNDLDELLQEAKFDLVGDKNASTTSMLQSEDTILAESVISPGSLLEGRSAKRLRLRSRYKVNLLAIARQGKAFKERIHHVVLRAGDVILCQGAAPELQATLVRLGGLPLSPRDLQVGRRQASTWLTLSLFALGIALSVFNLVPIEIGFAITVLSYILFKLVPIRTLYESVDWSILIMLAMLIPLGRALQTTGATLSIADLFVNLGGSWSPYLILGLLFLITMTLSDVMNNAATALVMAPVAAAIANGLQANIDPFLMTVAVSSSCSFLTPISHQNNTLVMGPGEYKFSDYLRLGIPLEVIIIALAIPLIIWIWPLY